MGSKSSPPPAPDPTATANAQAGYDKSTAQYNAALNRYNTYTPFGSQTWSQNGTDASGAPIWSQQVQLSPYAQQALNNSQQTQAGLSGLQGQALQGVQNTLNSNPFDQSKIPANPINPGQTAQDAIMSRLQPQMDLQNKQFESDQANKGIPVGSDAYLAAHRGVEQSQNDAMQQAALQGINLDMTNRQNAIQQQGYYANAPLNYLNGLMSGSQVQTPQFQSTPGIMANAPNYQNAVNSNYQGQLNAYNAGTGSQNSFMSGLFGLGSSALNSYFSDRRLKSNIVQIGKTFGGINVYEYDIFGQRTQGVMADEVEHIPGAVSVSPSGYKMVDYSKVR